MLTSVSIALLTIELASTPLERALCSFRALFTRTVPSSTILPSLGSASRYATLPEVHTFDQQLIAVQDYVTSWVALYQFSPFFARFIS